MSVALRSATWLLVLTAAPGVMHAVIEAAFLLVAVVDHHPRWPDEELNLSEAVAVRDIAEVARLVERGDDVDLRRPVRPGLLDGSPGVATPMEAAVSIRRPELIELLVTHGARLDPADWRRLRCYTERIGAANLSAALEDARPPGVALQCSGDERPWQDPGGTR